MRAFIAIDVPERLKDKLRALQAEMKQFNAPVRWVSPDGFHINLKFLGEMAAENISAVREPLSEIARETKPFEVYLQQLGTFPRQKSPRVIWTGVRSDEERLHGLAAAVDAAMVALGFPAEERAFQPHLTLGRVNGADNLFRLMTYLNLYSESQVLGSFPADTMHLYKSSLTPTGAIYDKIQAFPFGRERVRMNQAP